MKGKTPLQKKHPRCYSLDTLPLSTSTLTLFSFNKTCSSVDKIIAAGNKILSAVEHVLSAVEQILSAAQKHRLTVEQILETPLRVFPSSASVGLTCHGRNGANTVLKKE